VSLLLFVFDTVPVRTYALFSLLAEVLMPVWFLFSFYFSVEKFNNPTKHFAFFPLLLLANSPKHADPTRRAAANSKTKQAPQRTTAGGAELAS
jgi:hypothetical protein